MQISSCARQIVFKDSLTLSCCYVRFVHVCICVSVCVSSWGVCKCVYPCVCMDGRPKVLLGPSLFIKAESLAEPRACQFQLV